MTTSASRSAGWRATSPTTVFALDLRALAALRIAVAVLLIADLALRVRDLRAHYTDAGVLPRAAAGAFDSAYHLSLYRADGSPAWVGLLFATALLFAVALLLGWHTRVVTVASWLLLISLHNRNPHLLNGGDTLLRMLLFWGMFLPLGRRWSLDRGRAREPAASATAVFGGPTIAYVLQIAMIYAFSARLKTGTDWWNGSALFYAFSLDSYTTSTGRWLLQFPTLLAAGSYATLLVEWVAPVLLLVPVFFVVSRTVALLALASLHLAVAVTLRLGLFPWVDLAALLALVPSALWDRLDARASSNVAPAPAASMTDFSPATNVITLALVVYVALWNVQSLPHPPLAIGSPWRELTGVLRLDQSWRLFASRPARDDGWFVVPGVLEDGTAVDVYDHREAPVTWTRPPSLADTYPNMRWRKYLTWLRRPKHCSYRRHYAHYLCRLWNEAPPSGRMLRSLTLYFMLERTGPAGDAPRTRKVALGHYGCDAVESHGLG